VAAQTIRLGTRYVGILTDGAEWLLYRLEESELVQISTLEIDRTEPDLERLTVWLESIVATTEKIQPTPLEIERRLGV
jgi:predicted type IV restriction endonuclease